MNNMTKTSVSPSLPASWALRPQKTFWQQAYDLMGAPLRMIVLPDHVSERYHWTSLRAERFRKVLPELRGRVLDIGAGENTLIHTYRQYAAKLGVPQPQADQSVGVDVVDWGSDCILIPNSAEIPFPDQSFDTIAYIACLNHIPERAEALIEARRLLQPGGRVIVTMIGRVIGKIGHALWWYSEDKHREVDEHEEMGLNHGEVIALFDKAGFRLQKLHRFVYGLNYLYIFEPV